MSFHSPRANLGKEHSEIRFRKMHLMIGIRKTGCYRLPHLCPIVFHREKDAVLHRVTQYHGKGPTCLPIDV